MSTDSAISSVLAAKEAQTHSQIGFALARKSLDAQKAAGDAAVELIEAAGQLATDAQVDRLVLVRLRPPPFFEIQMTSLVGNAFKGEVVIASDGDLVFP